MMVAAEPISAFVHKHPTVKMLALSFLLLIGLSLILEGFDQHIPKGYIYFAMGFSVFVEMINLRLRKKAKPVHLHEPLCEGGAGGPQGSLKRGRGQGVKLCTRPGVRRFPEDCSTMKRLSAALFALALAAARPRVSRPARHPGVQTRGGSIAGHSRCGVQRHAHDDRHGSGHARPRITGRSSTTARTSAA